MNNLNFFQLLNYLTSFSDSALNTPAFRAIVFKGIISNEDVEKEAINKGIIETVKSEIHKRFDEKSAQYYCLYVDGIKNICDIMTQWTKSQ